MFLPLLFLEAMKVNKSAVEKKPLFALSAILSALRLTRVFSYGVVSTYFGVPRPDRFMEALFQNFA